MNHEEFSSKGGKAGTGKSKVRGDSKYYSQLAKKRRGDTRAGNARNRRTDRRAKRAAQRVGKKET